MKTVKILHCADVHIGAAESFLGLKAESRQYETLLTFERIIDVASESGVQLVLIAGDLFDSISAAHTFFERVSAKLASVPEIEVVYAAGNHDPLTLQSPFLNNSLPKNIHVLSHTDDCVTLDRLSVKVYGRSFNNVYQKGENKFSLSADSECINIMVLHGELKGDLNSEYNAVTPEFIASSGMDYIALGHIHKRSMPTAVGDTYYAYCGCPEGQGFDELGEKGVYIGEIGKGCCELCFKPIAKRMHLTERFDASTFSSAPAICDAVLAGLSDKYGDSYSENLYKIVLTGELSPEKQLSFSEIEGRLSEKLYFVKISDKTAPALDLQVLAKEPSLKGIFVKNMLSRLEKADECEGQNILRAIKLGLTAFETEVSYDD